MNKEELIKIKGILKNKINLIYSLGPKIDRYKHSLCIYQDKQGQYFYGVIQEGYEIMDNTWRESKYILSAYDVDNNSLGGIKFCFANNTDVLIENVEVKKDKQNRGIAGLMLSQTMDYITESLGCSDKNIDIIASGSMVFKINPEAKDVDRINYREYLENLYGKYGFEILEDREYAFTSQMRYNKEKKYRVPLTIEEEGVEIKIPEYELKK